MARRAAGAGVAVVLVALAIGWTLTAPEAVRSRAEPPLAERHASALAAWRHGYEAMTATLDRLGEVPGDITDDQTWVPSTAALVALRLDPKQSTNRQMQRSRTIWSEAPVELVVPDWFLRAARYCRESAQFVRAQISELSHWTPNSREGAQLKQEFAQAAAAYADALEALADVREAQLRRVPRG